jgi:major membrane immunogen (membrane-anchored lipoprotein)
MTETIESETMKKFCNVTVNGGEITQRKNVHRQWRQKEFHWKTKDARFAGQQKTCRDTTKITPSL